MNATLSYSAPTLILPEGQQDTVEAEWVLGLAALGVIAAFFGISVNAVVNICNWCHATSSFWVCKDAVARWFTTGC
jgi:hypothetical protein